MPKQPVDRSQGSARALPMTRRHVLGAAAGSAALLWQPARAMAQAAAERPLVFANTSVFTGGVMRHGVALAVVGQRIAAIDASEAVLAAFPDAEIYDGRGKALLPGLVNCHAHMAATIARGFNEDYGFPNSSNLSVWPRQLISAEEKALMVAIAALEAIKTGTTAIVENTSGIAPYADTLAASGLRCMFAESVRDAENVPGPMSPEGLAASKPPVFSDQLREEGMQRIADLHSRWHGAEDGRITVFPAAALAEMSSPALLRDVRTFAETHGLGYTIHLSQTHAELEFMQRYHGMSPPAFLAQHGFLGPHLFAAHCRYVSEADIKLLGESRTIVSHQAGMAANRGVAPPITELRAAGCPIANGTDNNTNDMFGVLRTALLTERIRRGDMDERPGLYPQPEDILEEATLGGARAFRQEDTFGTLDVGKKADLLVLDTQKAHLVPAGRVISAWIHNGQPSDIESSMIDGRFVMREGRVTTMDEAALIAEADKVGKRVWQQVREAGTVPIPGRASY